MPQTTAIHVAIRYSDRLRDRDVQTIQMHQHVIQKHGAVWFGKVGQPLSEKNISIINTQCRLGIPTYLYLFRGGDEGLYKGSVLEMARSAADQLLIPPYYDQYNLKNYMRFWTKLSKLDRMSKNELDQLEVSSAGYKLEHFIRGNAAGLFIVKNLRC